MNFIDDYLRHHDYDLRLCNLLLHHCHLRVTTGSQLANPNPECIVMRHEIADHL